MTKEEYIKMNRGINDSQDLPRPYLEAIYDEIASSEIKLKTSSLARQGAGRNSMIGGKGESGCGHLAPRNIVSAKQRRLAYNVESKEMSEVVEAIMVDISNKQALFTSATHVDHARHMFQVHHMTVT